MAQPASGDRLIDVKNHLDVRIWTTHYGCTEEQLRQAVVAVGPKAQNVREYIARQAKKGLERK